MFIVHKTEPPEPVCEARINLAVKLDLNLGLKRSLRHTQKFDSTHHK